MLHSSIGSCSHFKRALIPCYMYDSWWVCSKAFRFIIKWMKQYLCESKRIQMCAGVSCRLCLSPTWNLVGSGGNLLALQKWKHANWISRALIYDSTLHLAIMQWHLSAFREGRDDISACQQTFVHFWYCPNGRPVAGPLHPERSRVMATAGLMWTFFSIPESMQK